MAATTAAVVGGLAAVGGVVSQRQSAGDALDAQEGQNALNTAFILKQAQTGSRDAKALFKTAQENLDKGNQRGLDIFGQSIKSQSRLTQGGNVRAQDQLLAGLGLQQDALLGNELDLSQLQTQRLSIPGLGPQLTQLPNFKFPNLNPNRFNTPQADQQLAAANAAQADQPIPATGQAPGFAGQNPNFTPKQIQAALANNQGNLGPQALAAINQRLLEMQGGTQ